MRIFLGILLLLWGGYTVATGPLTVDLKIGDNAQATGTILGVGGFSVKWSGNMFLPAGDQEVIKVAKESQAFLETPKGKIGVQIGRALGVLAIATAIGLFLSAPVSHLLGVCYGVLAIPFWLWWAWGTPTFSLLRRLVEGLKQEVVGATPPPSIVTNAPWIVTIAAVVFNALLLIYCFSQPQKDRSR